MLREHKVTVNNKPHTIKLCRIDRGATFSMEIDGKTCQIELLKKPEYAKLFFVKTNGRVYKVELEEFKEKTPFFVRVNNRRYKVEYETSKMSPASTRVIGATSPTIGKQPSGKPLVGGENAVTAPMPGIVVSMKVEVGDSVEFGQPLCILEAMKMENEITAPKAGVVKEIHVSEGSSIGQGQQIVVIE